MASLRSHPVEAQPVKQVRATERERDGGRRRRESERDEDEKPREKERKSEERRTRAEELERKREGMVSRAVHNLVQDIARECNPLTLRRPSSYRCLPCMLDGTTAGDPRICFRFELS